MGRTETERRKLDIKRAKSANYMNAALQMNRPTPDPSQEGSQRSSASCQVPSWEGLGVGSWSQCTASTPWWLPLNRSAELQFCFPSPPALSIGSAPVQKRQRTGAVHDAAALTLAFRGSWAFTLIELLVVFAIIAILAALL